MDFILEIREKYARVTYKKIHISENNWAESINVVHIIQLI